MVAERASELDPSLDLALESFIVRIEEIHDSAADSVLRAAIAALESAFPHLPVVFGLNRELPGTRSARNAAQASDEILLQRAPFCRE
jgi:hypothetical protein